MQAPRRQDLASTQRRAGNRFGPLLLATLLASCLCAVGCAGGESPDDTPGGAGTNTPGNNTSSDDNVDDADDCTNCIGCCQEGQCVSGDATEACGFGGMACRACAAGKSCQSGSCRTGSQASGNDESEQAKDDSIDHDDPAQEYRVVLKSARFNHDDCAEWAWSDACDPFVKVDLASLKGETPVLDDTDAPQWDHALFIATASTLLSHAMRVEPIDEDFTDNDEFEACTIHVSQKHLEAGTLTKHCGKVKDVVIAFEPVR